MGANIWAATRPTFSSSPEETIVWPGTLGLFQWLFCGLIEVGYLHVMRETLDK